MVMIENYSEKEKLNAIVLQARVCLNRLKLRESASDAAFNYKGVRAGVRGGKRTTLDARHTRACEMYDCALGELKYYLEFL